MASTLAHEYPRLAPAFYLWAGSVSYSRLYKKRHHPSDVLVGAGIGIVTARLAIRYADRYIIPGKGLIGIAFGDSGGTVELRWRF